MDIKPAMIATIELILFMSNLTIFAETLLHTY